MPGKILTDDAGRIAWLEAERVTLDYLERPQRWEVCTENGIWERARLRDAIDAATKEELPYECD